MNNYTDIFLKCKECAFYYLNKKRHTKKELIEKLVKREYDVSVAKEVADYLEEANYIDDYDYARRYIHDAVVIKKYGLERIKRDLFLKGVDRMVIDEVVQNMEIDTKSVLDELIKKKALNIDFYDEKQLNKLQGFLLRRGFKFNEINDSLSEYRTKKENS